MLLIFTQIIKSNSTVISKPPLTNIIFNMLSWNTTVPWIWQAYYLEVHDSFKKKKSLTFCEQLTFVHTEVCY